MSLCYIFFSLAFCFTCLYLERCNLQFRVGKKIKTQSLDPACLKPYWAIHHTYQSTPTPKGLKFRQGPSTPKKLAFSGMKSKFYFLVLSLRSHFTIALKLDYFLVGELAGGGSITCLVLLVLDFFS